MNRNALKSLERIQRGLERARKRRAGGSTAPFVFAAGLVLADFLLVYLVPYIWETVLPRGLDGADAMVGMGALLWRSVVYCQLYQNGVRVGIVAATVAAMLVSRARPLRVAVWASAVGVLLMNAGILVVTLHAGLSETAAHVGLDLS
jgi:hypothetical protein